MLHNKQIYIFCIKPKDLKHGKNKKFFNKKRWDKYVYLNLSMDPRHILKNLGRTEIDSLNISENSFMS